MFAAVINDIMLPERKGKLALIDLKDQKTFGVGRVDNFTQRQLMDTLRLCGLRLLPGCLPGELH